MSELTERQLGAKLKSEALEAALNIQSLLDTGNKREEFDMALDDSDFWRDVRLVVDAVLVGASWPLNLKRPPKNSGILATDDETCTSCRGTGYDPMRERTCDCQPQGQS